MDLANSCITSTAAREIYWNLSTPETQILMYALLAPTMAVLCWALWRRYALWFAGQNDNSRFGNYFRRFITLFNNAGLQTSVNRDRQARVFHSLIYLGFMVLLFTTTMVFIDYDLGVKIYHGPFYLAVTVLSDLFGVALLIGVLIAFRRRFVAPPDAVHNTGADFFMLATLALLIVQGYALEALRIAVTADPCAAYSPVGYWGSLAFWSFNENALRLLHKSIWWFHTVTVFTFLALLPYTKFFHIISSPLNLFFRNLTRPKGALAYPGDIEQLMTAALEDSADGEFRIGVQNVKDLTWKQRLDLDACTSCGRCQTVCPAYNSGKILSPKWLILDTREHLLSLQAQGKPTTNKPESDKNLSQGILGALKKLDQFLLKAMLLRPANFDNKRRATNPLVQVAMKSCGTDAEEPLAGGVMDEDVFWSCTTCRACMEVCPVAIEHVDLITDVRRSMVLMEGKIPSEAQASLRAIESKGNPFGPSEERAKWTQDLSVPLLKAGDSVDVLYWVGCISSYDKRKQEITRAVVKILNAAGVNWGTLGTLETCTGDPARRLGEENLFQTMAKGNIELLKSISFKTFLANCPHCYNTMKNEYPTVDTSPFGVGVEFMHHTHFIEKLLREKKLQLKENSLSDVTYHDACYLGRYNDTYDEPREILVQLGAKQVKEMKDSGKRGLCCGAGGGHFWMDMKQGERVNVLRVEQALQTNAKTVATACPFCMHMIDDGIKLKNAENSLVVKDIAELVAAAL